MTINNIRIAATLFLLLAFLAPKSWAVEADIGTNAEREAGRKIYVKRCAQCHGVHGDGKGIAQRFLKPWPRDFTRGIYKFKSTPDDRLPTTEDILRVIRKGNPGTGMPAWPQLKEQELRNLAYHIKSFAGDFSNPEVLKDEQVAPIPLKLPSSVPRWNEASAKKGAILFVENKCQDCHGLSGRGNGTSAPTAEDMDGNQIRPRDLTQRWNFRNGSTRMDIFRTLSMGIAPMPSFHNLPEEQRWHLTDYVYSLGKMDAPNYGQVVVAQGIKGPIDISKGEEIFKEAPPVRFPVVGQIMQPGRAFYASVSDVEVQSIYNEDEIAFLLAWHDMSPEINIKPEEQQSQAISEDPWGEEETLTPSDTAQKNVNFEQSNAPMMEVPLFDPEGPKEPPAQYSDAVAIQIPAKPLGGVMKPYFIFGDKSKGVDLWFADLANDLDTAQYFMAKGAKNLEKGDDSIAFWAQYHGGRWVAIFKRKRQKKEGISFNEKDFTPIAFSFWDGFNNERGNKRGLTGWYHVYLKPMQEESILGKMAMAVLICVALQLTVVYLARRRKKEEV